MEWLISTFFDLLFKIVDVIELKFVVMALDQLFDGIRIIFPSIFLL